MWTVALLLVMSACRLKAVEISCEKIDLLQPYGKCCYLNGLTVISGDNIVLNGSKNLEVNTITFVRNKKVEFLPVDVYEKYPNLENYLASYASVKKISALNFKRLSNLKLLELKKNKIEFVPDDCFQDLIEMQRISLSIECNHTPKFVKFLTLNNYSMQAKTISRR